MDKRLALNWANKAVALLFVVVVVGKFSFSGGDENMPDLICLDCDDIIIGSSDVLVGLCLFKIKPLLLLLNIKSLFLLLNVVIIRFLVFMVFSSWLNS